MVLRTAITALGWDPSTVSNYTAGLVNVRTNSNKLKKAIGNKFFEKGDKLGKKLGNVSANGAVFKIIGKSPSTQTHRVLKIVKSNSNPNREFRFQKRAGNFNLAPKVHKVKKNIPISVDLASKFFSEPLTQNNINRGEVKIGAIIMNNLQQKSDETVWSFNDYMTSLTNNNKKIELLSDLWSMVMKLEKLGITHGDLHPWNVYVVQGTNKPRVVIIDFGRSTNIPMRTRTMSRGDIFTRRNVIPNQNYGSIFFTPSVGNGNVPVILDKSKINMLANMYKVNKEKAKEKAMEKTKNFLKKLENPRTPRNPGRYRPY